MPYINQPSNLNGMFTETDERLNKLENAQRFTNPNVPVAAFATVTAGTGSISTNGTTTVYTATNNFRIGDIVSVTGLDVTSGQSLNVVGIVSARTATTFTFDYYPVGVAPAGLASGNYGPIGVGSGSGAATLSGKTASNLSTGDPSNPRAGDQWLNVIDNALRYEDASGAVRNIVSDGNRLQNLVLNSSFEINQRDAIDILYFPGGGTATSPYSNAPYTKVGNAFDRWYINSISGGLSLYQNTYTNWANAPLANVPPGMLVFGSTGGSFSISQDISYGDSQFLIGYGSATLSFSAYVTAGCSLTASLQYNNSGTYVTIVSESVTPSTADALAGRYSISFDLKNSDTPISSLSGTTLRVLFSGSS